MERPPSSREILVGGLPLPKTFQGPFLDFCSAADSLSPLAVFETYWRLRGRGGPRGRTAAFVTLCGPLQLLQALRARAPALHRWNGRLYLLTAAAASLSALYLVWIRGGRVGGLVQYLGISGQALVILICAALSLRAALKRDFRRHRRWALRLYLAVSGVWFMAVGLFFWVFVNQGPVGFDPDTFRGPFLDIWSFGLGAATLATGIGVVVANLFLWSAGLAL